MDGKDNEEKLIIPVKDLRQLLKKQSELSSKQFIGAFGLTPHFNSDNIVEIAKSQFPRLEAKVAMHSELQQTRLAVHKQMEQTKRLLIVVAGVCLIAGSALVVFAPKGKEGVSYVIASTLTVLSLGAIGIQEFKLKTLGINIDASTKAIETAARELDTLQALDSRDNEDHTYTA